MRSINHPFLNGSSDVVTRTWFSGCRFVVKTRDDTDQCPSNSIDRLIPLAFSEEASPASFGDDRAPTLIADHEH